MTVRVFFVVQHIGIQKKELYTFRYASRLPRPGETLHGSKFVTSYGGKGANQCVAAAKLGGNTHMICKVSSSQSSIKTFCSSQSFSSSKHVVSILYTDQPKMIIVSLQLGDDQWGKQYKEHLKECGVNITYTHNATNSTTGIAQISVAENGENQIVIVTGANKLLSKSDVHEARVLIKNADILIGQLETPFETTLEAFKLNKGVSYVNCILSINLDPKSSSRLFVLTDVCDLEYNLFQLRLLNAAPAMQDIHEILPYCSILCVNEGEASHLTNFSVTLS